MTEPLLPVPALVVGTVRHTRFRPLRASFAHRHYQWPVSYTHLDVYKRQVRDVRAAVHGIPGTIVGGTEARGVDAADAASRDRGVIFPIIFVLVLLALLVLLRSVVAPIILVGTVILTFLAAVGASWWIFTKVFGFTALDVGAPLYTFLFLVALGVDYNIFLVTRAREEAAVHGSRAGMLLSLIHI